MIVTYWMIEKRRVCNRDYMWFTKSKIFAVQPFTEEVCYLSPAIEDKCEKANKMNRNWEGPLIITKKMIMEVGKGDSVLVQLEY